MLRHRSTARVILEPLVLAIALALAVRSALFRIYAIPSESMTPTLLPGDQILVTPYRVPFHLQPSRGDVVVFRMPGNEGELMVKRIVATSGDVVESVDGSLRVRGKAVVEPYVLEGQRTAGVAPEVVPEGSCFVLGDNRLNSLDSRSWGVLPLRLLVGQARLILWSAGDGGERPAAHASARAPALTSVVRHRAERLCRLIH